MRAKYSSAILLVTSLILVICEVSGKPATDIRKLPSITVDTLYPEVEDSETSESMGLIRTMMLGSQFFQKNIRPRQEANYVTLLRLPWRLARSVSTTGYGMARGFMDAFSQQMIQSYKEMQKNYIPQASQAIATWANPPPNPKLDTPWLDGGI